MGCLWRLTAQDVIRRGLSMLLDLDRAVQSSRQIDPSLDSGSLLLASSLAGIPSNGDDDRVRRG